MRMHRESEVRRIEAQLVRGHTAIVLRLANFVKDRQVYP